MLEPKKFVDFTEFANYLDKFKKPKHKYSGVYLSNEMLWYGKSIKLTVTAAPAVSRYYLKKYGSVIDIGGILYNIDFVDQYSIKLNPV